MDELNVKYGDFTDHTEIEEADWFNRRNTFVRQQEQQRSVHNIGRLYNQSNPSETYSNRMNMNIVQGPIIPIERKAFYQGAHREVFGW